MEATEFKTKERRQRRRTKEKGALTSPAGEGDGQDRTGRLFFVRLRWPRCFVVNFVASAPSVHSGGSTSTVPGGGGGGASFLNTATPRSPPSMPKTVPATNMAMNRKAMAAAPRCPALARSS